MNWTRVTLREFKAKKDTHPKPPTATYLYQLLTPVVLGRKIAVGCVQLSNQNFSYEIEKYFVDTIIYS